MHGLIVTNTEQLVKRKNLSEFNSNNKTSKRAVLDPQRKQRWRLSLPLIRRKRNCNWKQKTKLQIEAEMKLQKTNFIAT